MDIEYNLSLFKDFKGSNFGELSTEENLKNKLFAFLSKPKKIID